MSVRIFSSSVQVMVFAKVLIISACKGSAKSAGVLASHSGGASGQKCSRPQAGHDAGTAHGRNSARMKPDRRSSTSVAATPAGVVGACAVYRGCRCAQPPANGWHPCGMAGAERGMGNDGANSGAEPGGFRAISRWSRRTAPTPPERRTPKSIRIPEGCQL
jgi:hypothetical protein